MFVFCMHALYIVLSADGLGTFCGILRAISLKRLLDPNVVLPEEP